MAIPFDQLFLLLNPLLYNTHPSPTNPLLPIDNNDTNITHIPIITREIISKETVKGPRNLIQHNNYYKQTCIG